MSAQTRALAAVLVEPRDGATGRAAVVPAVAKLGIGAAFFGRRASGESLDAAPHANIAARSSGPRAMSDAEAFATVALAADAGVRLLDAPADHPDAERVLGMVLPSRPAFRLVAKTGPLSAGLEAVEQGARQSLRRLGLEQAHALLVPRAGDLLGPDGVRLWDRMRRLRDEGLYGRIGVCACVCDDPLGLARRFRPDVMQLPASLLDQRLVICGALAEIAHLGVEVQLRSNFRQGLLFQPEQPAPAGMAAFASALSRLRRIIAEAGVDPLQAAIGFALARPEASAVIVNVQSPRELRAILAAAAAPAPSLDWSALALQAPCTSGALRCAAA